MAVKRKRLKALASLSDKELRIARPKFDPAGPRHALERAVDMLGPFPAKNLPTYGSLRDAGERSDALQACWELGQRYFENLVEEQTAPRMPEVLANLKIMEETSRDLGRTLRYLSYAERYLLHSIWGIHPKSREAELIEMLNRMGDYGPPGPNDLSDTGALAPGALAENLELLHQFMKSLRYIINRRYTRPGTNKVDVGGSTNAANVLAPNPRWHLIHQSGDLFSVLENRRIEAEDGTPFQQFVSVIHEWVTGEKEVSFVTPLRAYLTVWKRRKELAGDLEDLRQRGPYSKNKFDAATMGGKRNRIPADIIEKAGRLKREIAKLDDKMTYGNRIPARDIVTG